MFLTYLLLGTNLGDKWENLFTVYGLIEENLGEIIENSAVYETKAWGKTNQPDFYNQVLKIETQLNAFDLLKNIRQIEKKMGRKRTVKWGERIIDIDILYYDDLVLQSEELQIPHPEIQNRRFTLIPLAEIAPTYLHPILMKSNEELLQICEDALQCKKIDFPNREDFENLH